MNFFHILNSPFCWILVGITFLSNNFSLEITQPSGWVEQSKRPPGIIKQFISTKRVKEFSPNLNINKVKMPCCSEDDTPIDSLIEKVTSSQIRLFPMYKVVEKKLRKINKINGAYIVTTYAQGMLDIANLQYFFWEDNHLVSVVYTCLLEQFDELRPIIEKSLRTLSLQKEKK